MRFFKSKNKAHRFGALRFWLGISEIGFAKVSSATNNEKNISLSVFVSSHEHPLIRELSPLTLNHEKTTPLGGFFVAGDK